MVMINSDFNEIINRQNTGSIKWDRYNGKDVIAMWIADMDFQSPLPIRQALRDYAENAIYGYTTNTDAVNQAVINRLNKLYNWKIDPSWIVWMPGLVSALNISCMVAGDSDNDEIFTFTPIYPPFLNTPKVARKKIRTIPLASKNNYYTIDFELFEKSITPNTKILLLSNPHNPVGRVFTKNELRALADICMKNNILICSDEIHCELLFDGNQHLPTASISQQIANNTITLMSSCKMFNLGGLNCGFAIIQNLDIRKKFTKLKEYISPRVTGPGYAATIAAYTKCDEWKADVMEYLKQNRDLVEDFINNNIPKLSMGHVQATFLAWIDATALGVDDPKTFFENAGVGLDDGTNFAQKGFVRLNFGCSRELLLKALNRMKFAVENHLAS
jgi:cysteine-S-conjugate beta-lyase